MSQERPLYTLYKNLKAQNYDVPDDYDRFENALTKEGKVGADNRHAIYENLKSQNFDVPDSYERFYSALFQPASKTSSVAKGGSVPMSEADKVRFSTAASNIAFQTGQSVKNAGRYNKLKQRQDKQKKDFGRVSIGSNKTIFGNDANNVVQDVDGNYVTSDNYETNSKMEAQARQASLDESSKEYQKAVDTGEIPSVFDIRDKNGNYDLQENIGKDGTYLTEEGAQKQLDKKLEDAYARKKEIEEAIAEDNRKNGNPLLSYSASIGGSNGRDAESSDYRNKLVTSLALVTQQIGSLEAVRQSPTSTWYEDAWKALDNTAFTAKTWDFGLTDFATMGQMERIKTKMDNDIPLSSSDKMLLNSKLGADSAAALEDEKMGKMYRWTKIAGQSLPFMADFFLTGGYGAITKGIAKGALKFAAKKGMGKISAAILKNTGVVVGDVIGSYAMAGTEQALKTGADIMQRHMGTLYQDGQGNYAFGTFDENGNLVKEGGESFGTALYKGMTAAMIENYTEKIFGHSYGFKKGAIKFMENHGMAKTAGFFKNIGSKEWYAGSKKWMEKFGINGFGEEVMEEEIGIPLNALLVGDNKASDLLDAKQQLDIIGGMAISVGSMYAMGVGTRPVKGIYNRGQYYRFKHKVDVADGNAQQVFGDKWADLKEKMDNATNEQMGGVLYSILQSRGNMSKEQINSAIMYGVNLMKMRGYNLGTTMQMNAKELTGEQDTPEEEKSNEVDIAYSEGHEAEGTDTHDIQIDQADKQKTLAELLGITEEQLSQMDDEQLDSLTGQDDKLDNAIYDYQMSNAKYQGVVDNAQDQVDLAAQQAAHQVDLYTDKSRGMVRNATVKATQGAEDYGVYIISGNLASHDDGTIDISGSDSMIIYFDPKTGTIEHADATRFSALGEEKTADEVKENAVQLAKEEAIKQISGIIDGRVDEGSQFTITDEQGNEHTYEVLADNGDGTAMVTIDGNVPTELVNGETVQVPYSFEDLQSLKDAEDAKRLAAAKEERAKFETERTGQAQQSQGQPSAEDTLDYSRITDKNGNVVQVEVNDEQGYPKFPDAKEIFLVEDEGYRSKVMVLDNEGNLTSHSVRKSSVQKINEVTLDEYRQMRQEELGTNIGETTDIEDEGGTDASAASEENQASDTDATPPIEEKQVPAITLEDGTPVPVLEDGNPDFSQLTAQQTAELYDTQFGEDAEEIIKGWVSDAKKALDKANSMKVSGRTFVEQKTSKEEKENAIADAQAKYDSAMAIADAYNERQMAKEESTSEGRKNLLEKAKAKYNRLKGKTENAQALWNDTVGKVLHRLYDGLGVNVFDHEPQTVEEYVSSSIAPFSLNYEGTETSKGVKQETGLERKDFAKSHVLAAEGKGMTIDDFVHKLWDNRPSQFENVSDQEIRNALLDLIMSDMNAYDMRHVIENNRIAQAEKEIEDEKASAENAAMGSQHNEEEETAPTGEEDNEQFPGKLREQSEENTEVPEDSTQDKPLGEQRDDVPFSAKGTEKLETAEERAENVERNRIEDTKVVDAIIGRKTRKALERIAKMMGAKIQWQYSDSMGNGWYDADTNTIHLTLDSSITEGVQFIFGHEMTHEIKTKNPEAYEELRNLVKEMMGEDTFDSMTDATQKRYNNAGVIYTEGRPAYEEEVVADQMGHWLQDANYAHTLAMKMSHPLLAKLHEIVNRIKMAFTGTEYTDNAKIILRSIEQAYVKTANGTFESPDTGDRYSLKEANERFNNEIENFKNKSHKGLMHLGAPSSILKACGVDANEITLSPKVLNKKLNQHSLTSDDVKDLVNAIQKPIMVYKHGEKSPNIVVITNANVRGNKLSLALELDTDGNVREMNNASSIHDKDAETEVKRWLSWNEGYLENALRWVDKEKVSDWLSSARLNSYSQTEYNQKLSSLAKVLNNFENPKVSEENLHDDVEKVQYSLRQKSEPTKKGIGYKVFVLKDGKLYPPMVANPNGAETPVGVWLDADAAPIAGESKTGRPQVKQGGKGTQGGSGKLAYRPGWHLGVIPYALQFNRKDAEGNKTLFPANFVFAEVEYAADKDYQEEAHAEGVNANGKYQHSLAGLKHLPTDGYYMYRTNPNPETDPWVITGAMKVNRILTRTEQADLVKAAGREPQQIQDGDIVTDEVVNNINQKIANTPKFSLKVYHGSGADFTEFDFSHMSEGAGSQAFGWGGYVTSSKKIGKDYANIKYDPEKDVEYVGKNKKPFTDLIATLFDGGIRDYDYVKNTLQEISDKDKSNISKKEEYDWFVSTKPEDWFNPNPKTNRNLYEVNIPDDNGKNYLGWNEPLTDEQKKIIYNGLVAKNIASPNLIVNAKANVGLKLVPEFRAVYDLLSKAYNLDGIQNASQFLSSLGFTGIKYKAGTIMGGAEEGDVNYVIFKPEDMQIAEHTKFSLKGNLGRIKRQTERNGGELIMLSPNDKVESLSTPSLNSAAKIGNSSETAKENAEKFSLKNAKEDRIQKLRESKPIEITGNEITPSDDLKQYKKNAKEYGKTLQGTYTNEDTGVKVQLQRGRKNGGVNEVLQHDYKDIPHLQSVAAIPQIIRKSIYIDSEENTDKEKNPAVSEYQYYVCGLKIGGTDYTVRSVFAMDDNGNRYYDHKLTDIEKGKLLDLIGQGVNGSSFDTTSSTELTTANNSVGKDKKLLHILQTNRQESAEKSAMSIEESIEDFASRHGVDMLHVATYVDAMKRKDVHTANWAMASMRVALRHKNSNLKLSEFKNVLKPIQEELYARFGNMDDLQKQYEQQVAAKRNVMEAARKKAEEEESKRQKHLEELAQLSDAEIDKKYMDSLEKGDETMAREMLDEAARRKGYGDANSDYQGVGAWAAPSNPGYETDEERRADVADNAPDVNLEDMALGYSKQPDDYFENPRAYGQNTIHGLESTKAIKTALDALKRGEKDVKVKVYRAVPTSIKEGKLRNGDWVTPSKTYADMHGNSRLEGKYRIIEDEVPANQLWWDGNDANEFGFDDGKEYKYKNAKNSRKLNDLVTRDDKGNIIPPSKRFNSRKSDIRFSLAGVRGAFELDKAEEVTTRLDNLNVARQMEEAKKDAKAIKVATGWERGADGKWRYEMPDAKMKDTIDIGGKTVKRFEDDMLWTDGKLGEYVDAPDLFKAYPQLKDVKLDTDEIVNDMPSNGAYDPNTNTITIHATEVKYLNSILNHEIQHAIQYIEGFATGGNELTVRDNIKTKLNDVTKEIKRLKAEGKMKEAKVLIEKNKGLYNAYTNNNDFRSYRSLAGEVEARNVQKRMGMTDEQRRNSLVSETEDVAREDQIFLGVDEDVDEVYTPWERFSIKKFGTDVAKASDRTKNLMKNEKIISRRIGSRAQAQSRVLETISRASDEFRRSNRASAKSGQDTWEKDRALGYVVRASYGTGSFITGEELKEIVSAKVGSGQENQVYLSKDGKTVVKLNNLLMVDREFRFNEFLDRIKAHNEFAPDDMYTPIGFALNHEGDFCLVLEQPYIKGEPATQEEIDDYLEEHGYDLYPIRVSEDETGLGWSSGIYEIWDTKPRNVLKDKNGDLHFIDTVIQHSFIDGHDDKMRFSLRADQYQRELEQWKKDNNLPKDAQRPSVPVREPGESSADFMKRIREYRQQTALWKTAPRYEQHLLYSDTAQGLFNQELQRGSVLARIALQDSMLPIRKAQEAIMKEAGVGRLNIAEDAYTAENRSHGKGKNEFEEYNDEFLQPLRKVYNKMMKNLGKSYDNVKIYMMAKHGLERNAHMAFKKALEADYEKPKERMDAYKAYKADLDRIANDADFEAGKTDFTTWRQKDNDIRTKYAPSFMDYRYDKMGIAQDYSGLSALFEGSDFEEAAADMVRDVESEFKLDAEDLWYYTNAATKKVLRDSYKAGMMTKEVYEYVRDMYKNYIPLRGWGGTNADQVWNYMGGGKGAFSQTLKEAKGRGSLADDPIAYIENMAESGILINNKNWVKQHLLLLAQNHPTSLLNVSKAWYIKTVDAQGNEEWIPASPNITAGMTSQQIENELEAFEKKMEKMKQSGDATQKREHLEISYPQTASEEREHEVRVMKDGEEYVIYINGDPQLAQSMNNTRAHRVREGLENSISQKTIAKLGRYMAAAYTSMSPLFIPSNFFRDFTMTLASTAIREDARYNWLLRKNMATHWNMYGMVRSYQEGTLREKIRDGKASKTEQMFYDFMMNGGETGFVSSLDVEDLKKKFKGELKDMNRMALNPKKVGHVIMEEIETLNRAIEDSNRFVIYMTSVEYGRSIEEAVNDAKDVTLNFNRKGTGEHGWQTVRNLYLFINPAIQSLQTLGALAKHHPFKFTAVTTLWLASGLLVPMVNKALMDMFGGDDDKDKYWSFTKWDRRNNLIMWVPFTHEFVKIPLAQEFRGFYGVGDMIASKLWGGEKAEQSWKDYGMDLMGQVIDMLPLDPTGYDGNVAVSMMPNPIRPMFELAFNVDFTGKPLFKDSEYNKYDPNFTKAYAGTPDWLVRISRMVNSVGNEYPDVQQNSIDKFGDPRFNLNNPAVVDHVMSSYLGGAYTMGSQVLGVLTKALNTPGEIKVADIPLVSKFVSNPDDRPAAKKKGDEFWTMKERHDRTANTLSKLKKQAKADGDYSTLEYFYGTGQYAQYKLDEREVKKYQEEKKAETARETGDETYQLKKLTADGVYKNHTTPKDDFEDMKMSQIYPKVNGIKKSWEALADMASSRAESFYDENAEIISAADEVADIRTQITDIKKDFLSDDGKDTFDAEGMRQIRALRKEALKLLERANRKIIAKQKAKATER